MKRAFDCYIAIPTFYLMRQSFKGLFTSGAIRVLKSIPSLFCPELSLKGTVKILKIILGALMLNVYGTTVPESSVGTVLVPNVLLYFSFDL